MNGSCKAWYLIGTLLFLIAGALPAQTIHVSLQNRALEGKPVFWNDDFVVLMSRDGQLVTFTPRDAQEFRQVSPRFQSHSQAMMRGELLREFGTAFDVTGTGQFLVVHPAGQRDQWANRFELLYRSMIHYLAVRGLPTDRPEFPLVAIVFPSQQQYLSFAKAQGTHVSSNTLGNYDLATNRITMYDVTTQSVPNSQWHVNAATIIHEAAHQTAFNVGVHSRMGQDPRWIVEGLGTMFEAPGVWDSRHHPQLNDRVHQYQLETYRRSTRSGDSLELLQRQLASDQLFTRATSTAYAHAWALTFYLTEREPRRYADYLRRLKSRPAFREYSPEERLRDFALTFGNDLKMFDARLQRFIGEL
jgi:hypothetical protein